MTAAIELLDKYKKTCSLASDNACAKKLGVTRAAVSAWRNGLRQPESNVIAQLADAIGEDFGFWLARIEAERARTPEAAKPWAALAKRLAQVAMIALIAGIGSVAMPAQSDNNVQSNQSLMIDQTIHYAQSFISWLRKVLAPLGLFRWSDARPCAIHV